MLYGLLIFLFVIVCILLMGIILLQTSKTGGMGGGLAPGAMNAAFGGQGADQLLVKITTGLAVSFMSIAIIIGMMDNPASRIDYSNKPTLSRNQGVVNTNNSENINIDKSIDDQIIKPLKVNNTDSDE